MPPRNINHESPKASQGTDLFDIMQDLMFYSSKQDIGLWQMLLASKNFMEEGMLSLKIITTALRNMVNLHSNQQFWSCYTNNCPCVGSVFYSQTALVLQLHYRSLVTEQKRSLANFSMTPNALINTIEPIGLSQLTAKAFIAHQN